MSKSGIVFLVIVSIIGAAAVSYFVVNNVVNAKSNNPVKGIIIPVGNPKEPSVTNISGSRAYLKYSISVEVDEKLYPKSEGKSINKTDAIIQDVIVQTLRTQKYAELKGDKQEELREKLKHNINNVLGNEVILNVYISTFVIGW